MSPPITRYARSDNVNIAHQVVGGGSLDLVWTPSMAHHVELAWESPAHTRFLNRLASIARLIVFDKRGTGRPDPLVGGSCSCTPRRGSFAPPASRGFRHAARWRSVPRRSPVAGDPQPFRAGLHTGECELVDGRPAGSRSTSARVVSEAAPNEVLVSSTIKDLVAGSGIPFEDRGLHALKGIPDEWRLFAVAEGA